MLKMPSKRAVSPLKWALMCFISALIIFLIIQANKRHQSLPSFLDIKLVLKSAIEVPGSATPEEVANIRESAMGVNAETMEDFRGKHNLPDHYGNGFCIVVSIEQDLPLINIKNFITDPETDCEPKRNSKLDITSIAPQLQTFISVDKIETLGPNFRTMKVDSYEYHEPYIYIGTTKLFPGPKIIINLPRLIYEKLTSFISLESVTSIGELRRVIGGELAYYQFNTKQDVHVLFGAGEVVHALIDPNGQIYVMTSYSTEYFPGINLHRLNGLGKFLNTPTGWQYKNYLITRPLSIRYRAAEGYITPRITDSYGNIYLGIPNQ